MDLVYIHGANATANSFNYIRHHIPHPASLFEYDSHHGFQNNLELMINKLKTKSNIFFIAHSLGGVYALHLAQHFPNQIAGAVTLSTPYGGSQEANIARLFLPFNRLMHDIHPNSAVMANLNNMTVPNNWTNVVSVTGASPFISKPNDGVVSIESMCYLADKMNIIKIDTNHYEVVQSDRVVNIIRKQLRVSKKQQGD